MRYLIKGGRVIDPANSVDEVRDVLIADGKIAAVSQNIAEKAEQTIDASGMIVAPGFIDMHVHLREPGREDKETVRSGTRAAVHGGFTAVACMPNTEPAIDSPGRVRELREIAGRDSSCAVHIVAAITEGRAGKKLADLAALKEAGAVAVSDDGSSVEDAGLMRSALEACKKHGLLLIDHCEDRALSGKGVMNKGFISTKMGLRGIARESEYSIVERDIRLAAACGAAIHIAHVSCKESVGIIRAARRSGARVTAETAPHYLALTEACCESYDTNTKMNPPLRGADDVRALKEGLADGTIDAIATDHAPHTDSEKDVEFDLAPFGVIGLETALPVSAMELVETKVLTWSQLIARLSQNPAKILGVPGGSLAAGARADIVIIDPAKKYVYARDSVESKSKNSPFIGWELQGRVMSVLVAGKPVVTGARVAEE